MNTPENIKNIQDFEIVNDLLLVNFSDGSEAIVSLKRLRDECPCAGCAGETDAFGNVYRSAPQEKTNASYQVRQVMTVGYYGLKPIWGDNHNTGIFSANLLEKLSKD